MNHDDDDDDDVTGRPIPRRNNVVTEVIGDLRDSFHTVFVCIPLNGPVGCFMTVTTVHYLLEAQLTLV